MAGLSGDDSPTRDWTHWLNVAGSVASLTALGYLLLHLPRKGESRVTVAGLPAHGRIPVGTAKRALKKLPRRYQSCGITPAELREGMEVEREHRGVTKGRVGDTARVAADHLCERRDYYKRIKKFVEP
jgi:hypothetical protein